MKKRVLSLPLLVLAFLLVGAQVSAPLPEQPEVPQVALIGEYESAFESLSLEHPGILLGVCGNDMDIAYEKWTDMLLAMEDHAESIGYSLDGLKAYFYIFWNADGSFRHLAFYPKSNSRNAPVEEVTAFLKSFVKEYRMTIKATEGYTHYGSAVFPTHARPEYRARKD